jgi:hypothetical protein
MEVHTKNLGLIAESKDCKTH